MQSGNSQSDLVSASLSSASDAAGSAAALIRQYSELTGLSFLAVDRNLGVVFDKTDPDGLELLPASVVEELAAVDSPRVIFLRSGLLVGLLPLPDVDECPCVAVATAFTADAVDAGRCGCLAAEQNWTDERLALWFARQPKCEAGVMERLLILASSFVTSEVERHSVKVENDILDHQLERARAEIALLRNLTRALVASPSPVELAELCVDQVHQHLEPAGTAVWLEAPGTPTPFYFRGRLPFDEIGMARLIAQCDDRTCLFPLIRNNVPSSRPGLNIPGLQNLLIAPIGGRARRYGWIVCCNLPAGREFGPQDAVLLNSLATIVTMYVGNNELRREHRELLLSFVRSLVSALDAKDPYTRGHSERVALIARRLGEEFDLSRDERHDLYVAGLLHDIGKVGIDDRVLQKSDRLDAEEFEHIRQHPLIGYSILQGLSDLRKVLPGVRNHHERYNGHGYPDRLRADDIPLIARIVAVADSYDAMANNRPYRKSLTREMIERIFHNGAGRQWDPKVIEAYFSAADDIEQICRDHAQGNGGLLQHGSLMLAAIEQDKLAVL